MVRNKIFTFFLFSIIGAVTHAAPVIDGRVYVASLVGDAISTVEGSLSRGDLISPNQNTITLSNDSVLVIILSNGQAVYASEASVFTLESFEHEAYSSDYEELMFEPARSNCSIKLLQGEFGFSHRKPVPTSQLQIKMPSGKITGTSENFLVVVNPIHEHLYVLSENMRFTKKGETASTFVQNQMWLDLKSTPSPSGVLKTNRLTTSETSDRKVIVDRAKAVRKQYTFVPTMNGLKVIHIRPESYFSKQSANEFRIK